jgi:uncharacterized membrane-anchored protein YitT (DUF2179 family)
MVEERDVSVLAESQDEKPTETKKYKVEKDEIKAKKPLLSKNIQTGIYMFLSAFFFAAAYHYFIAPCKFAPGGLPGIVAMIQFKMGVISSNKGPVDYSTFLMILVNVPLLIVASKVLNKAFAIKTFITAFVMTTVMFLLTNFIDPTYKFTIEKVPEIKDVGTRLVAAILGGAMGGVSLAFAFKVNASTGGADVVGAMLQKKYPHFGVGTMIFVVNSVIMAISIFVYNDNLMPVFLSLIYMFATSVVCDAIMQGSKSALKFEVITEHADEIAKDIIEEVGHGVTTIPAKGMFEGREKKLLICVIKPRQISKFQAVIEKYPDTFAYVGSVNEIIGKFNRGNK